MLVYPTREVCLAARAAIQRLAGLALKGGSHLKDYALTEIAEHIDLIVQIKLEDTTTDHGNGTQAGEVVGRRERFVSEIISVYPGENGHPAHIDVYKPGPDGRGVPNLLENDLREELRTTHQTGARDRDYVEKGYRAVGFEPDVREVEVFASANGSQT